MPWGGWGTRRVSPVLVTGGFPGRGYGVGSWTCKSQGSVCVKRRISAAPHDSGRKFKSFVLRQRAGFPPAFCFVPPTVLGRGSAFRLLTRGSSTKIGSHVRGTVKHSNHARDSHSFHSSFGGGSGVDGFERLGYGFMPVWRHGFQTFLQGWHGGPGLAAAFSKCLNGLRSEVQRIFDVLLQPGMERPTLIPRLAGKPRDRKRNGRQQHGCQNASPGHAARVADSRRKSSVFHGQVFQNLLLVAAGRAGKSVVVFSRPFRAWENGGGQPGASLADSLCPGLFSFAPSGLPGRWRHGCARGRDEPARPLLDAVRQPDAGNGLLFDVTKKNLHNVIYVGSWTQWLRAVCSLKGRESGRLSGEPV